jgi:predicted secreted protein
MKRRLLLALACLSGVLLVSCVPVAGPPIYDDTAKPVEVGVNDDFVIAIEYEPTTEYFWQEQFDNSALELLESTCVLCTEGELTRLTPYNVNYPTEAGAVNFSRFKALRRGETEVTMVFKRPLKDTFIEQKIFRVIVN